MIHLANIMIVTDDAGLGANLRKKLEKQRYKVRVVAGQADALREAESDRPDIILLGDGVKGGDPITLTRMLKAAPATTEIAVCLITTEPSSELQNRALAAGMADVLAPPVTDTKLIARLRPLIRLSSMQVELKQRAIAAKGFEAFVAPPPPPRQEEQEDRILLIGGSVDNIAKHLPHAKLSMVANPYVAEDELETKNYDVAIAVAGEQPEAYLDLCVQSRNNPRLFNLPMVLIADPRQIDEETAYQHGVSGYFANPADPFVLHNSAMFLVRRQRMRWAIREALVEAARPAIKDPATGVFSRAFFDAYLPIRVNYAQTLRRPLSIAFFRVPDVENIRQRFGDEQANHLRLQVSQWITGLLRVEDMTARYEENEFCVVLPDSPQTEASLVINRIAGVLAYTDFAVRDVYEPVKVWVRIGSAEMQEGESAESLIARARQAMVE
jgi:two-component system cell cycle response regulator